jgi:hypothetical protein
MAGYGLKMTGVFFLGTGKEFFTIITKTTLGVTKLHI